VGAPPGRPPDRLRLDEAQVSGESAWLLATLALLEIKHALCDFFLQTTYQVMNKGTYGHAGGVIHAGLHALGTAIVLLIVGPSVILGVAIVVIEFAIHYHLDWGKEQVSRHASLTPEAGAYWWAFGTDQLLHHLTYIAIAAVLALTKVF
jgi:hypothetical protein